MIENLRDIIPTGAQDNLPALVHGWDLAAANPGNVLLWIHGPQPVLLGSAEGLRQRLERNLGVVRVLDFQTGNGPNRILEKLDGMRVQTVARAGDVADDLKTLFASVSTTAPAYSFLRQKWNGQPASAESGEPVSKHVARLWALSEINHLGAHRKVAEAIKLAQEYQLVATVSGAVVLETMAQYAAADLTPVDAETVPMVPEPAVFLLLAFGVAGWFLLNRFRRAKSVC